MKNRVRDLPERFRQYLGEFYQVKDIQIYGVLGKVSLK